MLACHRGSAQWGKAARLMASKQSDQGRDGRCHSLQEHVRDDLETSLYIHDFKVSASSQLFHLVTKHLTHEILMCLRHIRHNLTNCGRQPGWGHLEKAFLRSPDSVAIEIHTVGPDCCGSNLSSQLNKYSMLSTLLNLCAQFTSLKNEEHCGTHFPGVL